MRVLSIGSVYPPHLLGGYEVIWQGVSRALVASGHASRVLVSDFAHPDVPPGSPDDPDVHRELGWYWQEHRWPRLGLARRASLERHNAAVLDRHLRAFRPDVVAFWPMGGMSLSLITRCQRAGLPTVFFVQDPWPVYGPVRDQWLSLWSRPGWRRLRGVAERVTELPTTLELTRGRWVFCSDWLGAETQLSLAPEQQSVLAPGIDDRYLSVPVPPRPWSWELLYLGRVVEQKGVLSAVEALALAPAQARLTIIGSGDADYRRQLETRPSALGLGDRVRFRAPLERAATPAAYAGADVVLHPVLWGEPWGLVPLEAMGVGRPVIATGRGGSADYLVDGVNCLLHPPGDAVALAAAVRRLAEDAALRDALVVAGRETAAQHTAAAFNRQAVRLIAQAAGG